MSSLRTHFNNWTCESWHRKPYKRKRSGSGEIFGSAFFFNYQNYQIVKHRKGSLPEWRRSLFIILRTIQLISIRITMRRSSPLSIRRGCHCDSKHILPGCNQSGVDFQKIRRELHPIRVIHCFFRAKSPFGCRFQDFFSTSTPISANRVYISEKIFESYTRLAKFPVFSG